MAAVSVLVSCLDDPRAGQSVKVVNTCDVGQLSTDPASPQASLRLYVQASDELRVRATAVETELKDACNAADTELGLPTGQDALTACKPIAARVAAITKNQARPEAPFFANWAELRYTSSCSGAPDALAKCISQCTAGGCDATKCEPTKLAAVCQGTCKGACLTQGDNLPCTGACVGDVKMDKPSTCGGECQGVCVDGPNWYGHCDGACAGQFVGRCEGTCTGVCNGQPINPHDAGAPPPPPDGGGGGGPPPLDPPPTNADGNCQGVCVGVCSKGSEGLCIGAPCLDFKQNAPPDLGHFSGGNCFSGLCGGVCKSALGNSSPTTCSGQCAQAAADCKGLCAGPCDGTTANPVCTGALKCSQNAECENACEAKALLDQNCDEPKTLEMYALTDPKLLVAWQKYGAKIGKALAEVKLLRQAYGFIGTRAYGDFVAIGLSGDLVRACVAKGAENVAAADVKIRAMTNGDPTIAKGEAQ